jgi:hypothetical protein
MNVNNERPTLFQTIYLEQELGYTGRELRSHFIREVAGIQSDGAIAFSGACEVSGDRLVDLEDVESGSVIVARNMLHLIGEHFQCGLREVNARLRVFASIVKETLEGNAGDSAVERVGDDLFIGARKLSVAIATVSPVSALFHFGVNIDPAGAPVPAIGLQELGVEPRPFALDILERYTREDGQIEEAIRKVRGVP